MIVDFSTLEIGTTYSGSVTFLSESAGFRNAFGMYKIGDDGEITDVTLIFGNSSATGSGGDLIPGGTRFDVTFTAEDKVGFFVAPNADRYDYANLLVDGGTNYVMRRPDGELATIHDTGPIQLYHVGEDGQETVIRALYSNRTWHSTAEAENNFALNGDGTDHTIWDLQVEDGTLLLDMRFEDLWRGGDRDYTDIVFRLDAGPDNTLDAIDSGKDPANALAASDRVIVQEGQSVIFDPLANDSGEGLTLTHLNGTGLATGESITLSDGEVVTLLEGGQIRIEGADAPDDFNKLMTYTVMDETGATDSSVIAIVTPAFAKNDAVMVTARGTAQIDLLANDTPAEGSTLSVTHIAGNAVEIGSSFTLASGTNAIYRGDGVLDLYGADITTDLSDQISYQVVDETGLTDTAFLDVTTSPVDGTTGNDTFSRSGQRDTQGNQIGGSDGAAEVVMGYGGNDKLFTGDGDDALYGGTGNDNLRAGAGNDLLFGGDGHDLLSGGTGVDEVHGGHGNDAYWVDHADDLVVEEANAGTDKVRSMVDWALGTHFENLYLEDSSIGGAALEGTGNALNNFVGGNDLSNHLLGLNGNDRMVGMTGDDIVDGGAGRDVLNGGDGNDQVIGGTGRDKLWGDAGDDRLTGGADTDVLIGGSGADVFVFAEGDGFDVLYDFSRGEDLLEFAGLSFEDLTLSKRGAGTLVRYGDGDSLYAAKLGGEMLSEADFLFV